MLIYNYTIILLCIYVHSVADYLEMDTLLQRRTLLTIA